jgi:serine/threonine-protein kinase RsbW
VSESDATAAPDDDVVLRIPAAVEELARVRRFIRHEAARAGADPRAVPDVVQAVDECVANTILHGYRGGPGTVEVEVDSSGDALVVRLRDHAPAFDPTKLPSPDITLPLEQRPLGGLGVFLTRELMDEVTYRQTSEGNELTLVKQCLEPTTGGGTC